VQQLRLHFHEFLSLRSSGGFYLHSVSAIFGSCQLPPRTIQSRQLPSDSLVCLGVVVLFVSVFCSHVPADIFASSSWHFQRRQRSLRWKPTKRECLWYETMAKGKGKIEGKGARKCDEQGAKSDIASLEQGPTEAPPKGRETKETIPPIVIPPVRAMVKKGTKEAVDANYGQVVADMVFAKKLQEEYNNEGHATWADKVLIAAVAEQIAPARIPRARALPPPPREAPPRPPLTAKQEAVVRNHDCCARY